MRKLTVGVILGLLMGCLLALPAAAGDYCQQGDHHQCGETTTTIQEETTTTEVPTTTTEDTTTTSTDEGSSTTTTTPESTTSSTTILETTSTTSLPDTLAAGWDAYATCFNLTVEFGEGISQVDVYLRDEFGDFGPADGLEVFTESGTLETGIAAEWILVPVVLTGYTAVPPENVLHTEHCSPVPSTTPEAPTPELPLTGSNTKALVAVAAALSVLGFMLVKEAGR